TDLGDRCAADQAHGALGFPAQGFEHPGDTLLATAGKAVQVGAAHHASAGPHGHRLDDLAAAANTTVDDDFNAITHRVGNLRHHIDGGRGAIQLAATVVGDDDGGGADIRCAHTVLHRQHALDGEWLAPVPDEFFGPLPGDIA